MRYHKIPNSFRPFGNFILKFGHRIFDITTPDSSNYINHLTPRSFCLFRPHVDLGHRIGDTGSLLLFRYLPPSRLTNRISYLSEIRKGLRICSLLFLCSLDQSIHSSSLLHFSTHSLCWALILLFVSSVNWNERTSRSPMWYTPLAQR